MITTLTALPVALLVLMAFTMSNSIKPLSISVPVATPVSLLVIVLGCGGMPKENKTILRLALSYYCVMAVVAIVVITICSNRTYSGWRTKSVLRFVSLITRLIVLNITRLSIAFSLM